MVSKLVREMGGSVEAANAPQQSAIAIGGSSVIITVLIHFTVGKSHLEGTDIHPVTTQLA